MSFGQINLNNIKATNIEKAREMIEFLETLRDHYSYELKLNPEPLAGEPLKLDDMIEKLRVELYGLKTTESIDAEVLCVSSFTAGKIIGIIQGLGHAQREQYERKMDRQSKRSTRK